MTAPPVFSGFVTILGYGEVLAQENTGYKMIRGDLLPLLTG